ncbi:MAG: polymerase [Spirochaetes bacterium GWD1_27_9]|nr:MAG: polymerase [Spirochaetes bacterium GWB1_27_13]OHD23185.1 MAG: polymerase [Spirochaetes bacterium GWC1_27_15]OHD42700.1 MAG: polymerase [Spirochaetes bacterium GWD1_27_9]
MFFKTNYDISKTSKMMDENQFWEILKLSLENSSNLTDQERYLIKYLSKLTPEEIIGFRLRTDKLLYDSYISDLWCAAYIINGGCSDDSFEYFRTWLISRGKEIYYTAIKNPDILIDYAEEDECDFESFWYVAIEAFKIVTKKELYDYIDYDNFTYIEGNYPEIKFNWDDTPESQKKICPKLFKKCNG